MELAKLPQPQETLPRQTSATSALLRAYAGIGAVSLPAQAVFGQVALLPSCLFQLFPARCRGGCVKSGPETRGEAVVFSCLFQLAPARRQGSGPERREGSCGFSQYLSLFGPTLPLFQLRLSLFRLTLPRACPAPFSVEPVAVQRLNFVFGRRKSSRKR